MQRRNTQNPRPRGLEVFVKNNNVDYALRKLKKKIAEDGIMNELKERQFYIKPSEKQRKAKAASRAREQSMLKKRKLEHGY